MKEPEVSCSISEDSQRKTPHQSSVCLKEPKEEPLDFPPSFSSGSEISNNKLSFVGEKECKKEEVADEEFLGAFDQSGNDDICPLSQVEPKTEVIEDRVIISVENPDGLEFAANFNDIAMLVDDNIRRSDRTYTEEKLAFSSGLPVSAHEIVEMSTRDLIMLLKSDSLTETQRRIIRKIRRNGLNNISRRKRRLLLKDEETAGDGKTPHLSSVCLKEPKEEPLDFPPSFSSGSEIPNNKLSFVGEKECKKEVADEEFLGAFYQSGNDDDCPLSPVEPKTEVIEDRVIISVENPDGLEFAANFNGEAMLEDDNIRRGDRTNTEDELASISCLPLSAQEIVEMSTSDFTMLLKSDSLTETQRGIIRKIRANGKRRVSRKIRRHRNNEETTGDGKMSTPIFFNFNDPSEILTPQCILCKEYPITAFAYAYHLTQHHKYPLIANGISLLCSCGVKVFSHVANRGHKCNGLQYTLHKLENRSDDFPDCKKMVQCMMCEAYPTSAYGYASHLYIEHYSSLEKNGIYLLCSCGFEIHAYHPRHRHINKHNKECDAHHFTIRKLAELLP